MARASLGTCRESARWMILKRLRARGRRHFSEPGVLSFVGYCFHSGRWVLALKHAVRDHPEVSHGPSGERAQTRLYCCREEAGLPISGLATGQHGGQSRREGVAGRRPS